MKLIKLAVLFFLIFTAGMSDAQSILVKVKKGTAKIGSQILTVDSKSTEIKSSEILEIYNGSLVIARQDVIVVELSTAKKYPYKDISSIIQSKKDKSSGGFVTVAFGEKIQKNSNSLEKGATSRGATGFDYFYPYDNTKATESNIVFFVGNNLTKMESNIVLKDKISGKVYFDGMPKDNKFEVSDLPPGDYEWRYFISIKDKNSEKQEFLNVFSVLSKNEADEIKNKIKNYKNDLKQFSPKLQQLLIEEYCDSNNYYLKR